MQCYGLRQSRDAITFMWWNTTGMFRIQGRYAEVAQRTIRMGDKEKSLRVIVPLLRREMVRYQKKKLSVALIRILLDLWQPLVDATDKRCEGKLSTSNPRFEWEYGHDSSGWEIETGSRLLEQDWISCSTPNVSHLCYRELQDGDESTSEFQERVNY